MRIKETELADRNRRLAQAERDLQELREELQGARAVKEELERSGKRCRELEGQLDAWKERWAALKV
jgi:chromosome segregation ATPase